MQPQPMRKRKTHCYALVRRNRAVLLVRRPADASLMAGMWELPTLSEGQRNGGTPVLKLRHAITDTDYQVSVIALPLKQVRSREAAARWFTPKQWERLPLTGLARKVLRKLEDESSEY